MPRLSVKTLATGEGPGTQGLGSRARCYFLPRPLASRWVSGGERRNFTMVG